MSKKHKYRFISSFELWRWRIRSSQATQSGRQLWTWSDRPEQRDGIQPQPSSGHSVENLKFSPWLGQHQVLDIRFTWRSDLQHWLLKPPRSRIWEPFTQAIPPGPQSWWESWSAISWWHFAKSWPSPSLSGRSKINHLAWGEATGTTSVAECNPDRRAPQLNSPHHWRQEIWMLVLAWTNTLLMHCRAGNTCWFDGIWQFLAQVILPEPELSQLSRPDHGSKHRPCTFEDLLDHSCRGDRRPGLFGSCDHRRLHYWRSI